MRIIVVAVLATVAVLAMVGVLLVFVFSQLTEDREDASARRTDRSTREDNPREGSVPEVAQELRLVAIVPSPRIVRLDGPGETERLAVQGYYSDRSVGELDDGSGATVSYSSSDPSVAEVDTRGFVTGLSAGGADIIVTYGDLIATVPVFVWGTMKAVPPIDPERLLEVSEDGSAIVLNRVMVELEPGRDAHDADEVATGIGGQVVFEYRTFRGYLVEFDGRTDEDLREALVILQEDSRVASAYPDAVSPVNDGHENQIETLLFDTRQPLAYLDAGMENAWRTMGLIDNLDPVTVAVIDTGFAFPIGDTVADMVLRTEFDYDRIEVRDAVSLAEDGDVPHDVEHAFHGVAVASVLVARNNQRDQDMEPEVPEESFSGVITSVDDLEYGLIIYGTGAKGYFGLGGLAINDAAVVAALEDIWQFHDQVDVVNLSLGGGCKWHEYICNQRLDGFRARLLELMGGMPDVTFVAGAGNSAEAADKVVPAQLSLVLPNVITVGGTLSQTAPRPDNVRWEGSNFGPAITLGAPGEGVLVVDLEYGDGYGNHEGTSFSAPMVAGTAALLRALDPELEPAEIRRLVVEAGEPRPVCTTDETPCPLRDQETWSVLNAGEAVGALLWPSVSAEIAAEEVVPETTSLGSDVGLMIPIANTGTRTWNFHLSGTARSPSGKIVDLGTVRQVVRAGESHPFKLGLTADEVGSWEVEAKIYRNPEKTSASDSATFWLGVASGHADEPWWESVSAGGFHSCGVKTDGALVCWGFNEDSFDNYTGQANPPAGSFQSVSAGLLHNCGVRSDWSLTCWGDNSEDQSRSPGGRFTSVNAGVYHTCGVRMDGSAVCWGINDYGEASAPDGEFRSVSAGGTFSCGVAIGNSVICWGYDEYHQSSPPRGSFNSVSAGLSHACGVKTNGSVLCWGSNDRGQAAAPDGDFISVSAGFGHSCGVMEDGSVACWGSNEFGMAEPPDGRFQSVTVGPQHSCGVSVEGAVVCWGSDGHGRATPPGGTVPAEPTGESVPNVTTNPDISVSSAEPLTAVSVGGNHTCGVGQKGTISCWGQNDYGKAMPPSGSFTSVSSGGEHTCGVRGNGVLICWGLNWHGRAVPPQGQFTTISAGDRHTCGIGRDGSIACWGWGEYGRATPPQGRFTAVSAGYRHTCAIREDGSVACWGSDQYGQATPPPGQFISISAGGDHTCGVTVNGFVTCWGGNRDGQATPLQEEFSSVSAGWSYTCGLKADGTVACWGSDGYGEATPPEGRFLSVSAGELYNCGVRVDGSLSCWGFSAGEQTQPPTDSAVAGTTWAPEAPPTVVDINSAVTIVPTSEPRAGFASVSVGWRHACGVKENGLVVCWGDDYGGITIAPSGKFAAVSAGVSYSCGLREDGPLTCWGSSRFGEATPPSGAFASISVGEAHTCGIRENGSVVCWGYNEYGQAAPPSGEFASISAGRSHTCAVRKNGSVSCWGLSDFGQSIPPNGRFTSVSAAEWRTCGLKTDGSIVCWGWNTYEWLQLSLGKFTAVSIGPNQICGLVDNGSVICWSDDYRGRVSTPPGRFASVSVGEQQACGVKVDGSMVCWGWDDFD